MTTTISHQPEVRTVLDWNPDSVKAAESLADTGDISKAGDLCERILADDRVMGVMAQRTSLVRLPLTFEPGNGSKAGNAIELLEERGLFWKILPSAELRSLHAWGALLGFSPGLLEWNNARGKRRVIDGVPVPRLTQWHPRHFSFDSFTRQWSAYVNEGAAQVKVEFGRGEWCAFTPSGAVRPWSRGVWRAARLWWLLKQYAIQDWARYSELHGRGAFVATSADGASDQDRRKLARAVKQLGDERAITLPAGWDLKLIESTANTYQTYVKQIELADTGLAIAIVGQNLSSQVKGGSLAASETHEAVAAAIVDADASALSEFIREQILGPWCEIVLGEFEAAPWPKWDSTPPDDDSARVKVWLDLGDAIIKLKSAGLDVDAVAMAETAGVPLKSEKVNEPNPPTQPGTQRPEERDDDGDDVDEPDESGEQEDDGEQVDASACCHVGNAVQAAANAPAGIVAGQDYADRVTLALADELRRHLAPHMRGIRAIVEEAETLEGAQEQIAAFYADVMNSEAMAKLFAAGMQMSGVGGAASVLKDK